MKSLPAPSPPGGQAQTRTPTTMPVRGQQAAIVPTWSNCMNRTILREHQAPILSVTGATPTQLTSMTAAYWASPGPSSRHWPPWTTVSAISQQGSALVHDSGESGMSQTAYIHHDHCHVGDRTELERTLKQIMQCHVQWKKRNIMAMEGVFGLTVEGTFCGPNVLLCCMIS